MSKRAPRIAKRKHVSEFIAASERPMSPADFMLSGLKEEPDTEVAPLEAGVTLGVPADQIPRDLRTVRIDNRHSVWVRLQAPLNAGCGVALVYTNKKFRSRVGRYWPGSPEQFAEFVDPWSRTPKIGKRKPVSSAAWPVRVVGVSTRY